MVYKSFSNYGDFSGATVERCEPTRPASVEQFLALADGEARLQSLSEVISAQIVPRLLMIHHEPGPIAPPPMVGQAEVCEFSGLAMGADSTAATSYFEEMRARGHSLDTLFLHLLAPTARYLGQLWEEDRCDFIDVTLGVARLQEILAFSGAAEEARIVDLQHRALLISPRGETHVFGIDMVGRMMSAAGWDVLLKKDVAPGQSEALVSREWIGVVGVTLSAESGLEALARMIKILRRESSNALIGVMVGGPLFNDHPELAVQVGADASASDAPTAVILAKRLLMRQAAQQAMA